MDIKMTVALAKEKHVYVQHEQGVYSTKVDKFIYKTVFCQA